MVHLTKTSSALARTRVIAPKEKTMKRLAAFPFVALAVALAPSPAAAQGADEPKVNQLIIYGNDKCPPSTDNQITVCARLDENERYRIPEDLREVSGPENTSWANKVKSFEAVGNFGPLSCTPVGAGGEFGCTEKMIAAAYAEKANSSSIRFAELIAKARQERLAKIDESAAATQTRVEAIEKEQKRLEAQGVAPAEAAARAEQAIADQEAQGQPQPQAKQP
jgi:hypothetical protein